MAIDYDKWLNSLKMFPPEKKSTFSYWWAHYRAFNLMAMKLGVWKFRHLFHDIEKPFLKLFLPYKKVRHFHRRYHRHHRGYRNPNRIHWLDVIIDNECGMYTKEDSPLNARAYCEYLLEHDVKDRELIEKHAMPMLDKLGLMESYNRDERNTANELKINFYDDTSSVKTKF